MPRGCGASRHAKTSMRKWFQNFRRAPGAPAGAEQGVGAPRAKAWGPRGPPPRDLTRPQCTRQIHYLLIAAATATIAAFGPVPRAQTPPTLPPPGQAPSRGGGPGGPGAQTIPSAPGRGRGVPGAPALDDPANANGDFSPRPPVVALTPEEEAKRLWLPAGTGSNRCCPIRSSRIPRRSPWTAMAACSSSSCGYFQTPEGIDLIPPDGRISMHEDRDGDGVYERHTVFVDKMVFPRFVLPFGAEHHPDDGDQHDEVWKYTDTNGDGVADKKDLFTTNFGRAGTMESSTVPACSGRWTTGCTAR